MDEQPDRRQDLGHSVPALDDRAVLEQGAVQGSRPRSGEGPGQLGPDGRVREEADQDDASGNVTQYGVKIPSSGFPYWLFQGLTTPNDVELMNEAGTETYFDKPAVIEALQYWVDLSEKHKVSRVA